MSTTKKNKLDNLTNISENVTREECVENGRKGGIASGKARREKKEMKEMAKMILNMGIKGGEIQDFQNLADTKGKNITVEQALLLALVNKAMKGDVRAFEALRDTAGMKPVDKQEVVTDVRSIGKLDEVLNALKDK